MENTSFMMISSNLDNKLVNAAVNISITLDKMSKRLPQYKQLVKDLVRLTGQMSYEEYAEFKRRII